MKKMKNRHWLKAIVAIVLTAVLIPSGGMTGIGMTVLKADPAADVWDGTTVADAFDGGDGSEGAPYQIATGAQLAKLAADVRGGTSYSGKYFQLTSDIDLDNKAWTRIGTGNGNHAFQGRFDGNHKTISNLHPALEEGFAIDEAYYGLFGCMKNAEVKDLNLTLPNVTVDSAAWRIGGLAGFAEGSTVSGISVTGEYTVPAEHAKPDVGGIIGYAYSSEVSDCTFSGAITAENAEYVGGICGYVGNSSISRCINTGTITGGTDYAGGILGLFSSSNASKISTCKNTGDVEGGANYGVGGILGGSYSGTLEVVSSYNTGEITSPGTGGTGGYGAAAGLVGYIHQNVGSVTLSKSFNAGSVKGKNAGGLVGVVVSNTTVSVTDSYESGVVEGTDDAGGFIGSLGGTPGTTITSSYAVVDVYAPKAKNGTGSSGCGYFIGDSYNGQNITLTNAYYYPTDELMLAVGRAYQREDEAACIHTYDQFKNAESFTGWDFANTWVLTPDTNRPRLRAGNGSAEIMGGNADQGSLYKVYEVYVSGVKVTDANKGNLIPDINKKYGLDLDQDAMCVTYTPATESSPQKLTLSNYVIEESPGAKSLVLRDNSDMTLIGSEEDLIVELVGENSVGTWKGHYEEDATQLGSKGNLTVTGNGSLTLMPQVMIGHSEAGICTWKNLTISDGATVIVQNRGIVEAEKKGVVFGGTQTEEHTLAIDGEGTSLTLLTHNKAVEWPEGHTVTVSADKIEVSKDYGLEEAKEVEPPAGNEDLTRIKSLKAWNVKHFHIQTTAGEHGSVEPSGDVVVADGDDKTFTLTPDAGCRVSSLMLDTENVTAQISNNKYTLRNVTANHTLTAAFELVPTYDITVEAGADGTVAATNPEKTIEGGKVSVTEGASQTFTFTPAEGAELVSVILDKGTENETEVTKSVSSGSYTLSNVTAAHTLTVTFSKVYYITAAAGEHGTAAATNPEKPIGPDGKVKLRAGESQEFTFTPDKGYMLESILVDGAALDTPVNPYTFNEVNQDHTIGAVFSKGYNVLFYDGEKLLATRSAKMGQTVTAPPESELTVPEGKVFAGWYTGKASDVSASLWDQTMPVTHDLTLYARYADKDAKEETRKSAMDPELPEEPSSGSAETTIPVYVVKGQKFTLSEKYTWESSDTSKKVISLSKNNATVKGTGTNVKLTGTPAAEGVKGKLIYNVTAAEPKIDTANLEKLNTKSTLIAGDDPERTGSQGVVTVKLTGTNFSVKNFEVHWATSNEEIAKVEGEGGTASIIGFSKGSATITAYVNGKAYTCKVKVADAPTVKTIETGKSVKETVLTPMQTITIKTSDKTFKANGAVWQNDTNTMKSDPDNPAKPKWYADNVVYITSSGKLTAIGVGETTLTGTYKGSDGKAVTAKFKIVVNEPAAKILYVNEGQTKTVKLYNVKTSGKTPATWETKDGTGKVSAPAGTSIKIKGESCGYADVTVKYEPYKAIAEGSGFTYAVRVYVEKPELKTNDKLTGSGQSYTLELSAGETIVLESDTIFQPVLFKSNKNTIAFVDEAGVVSARKSGTANLSAKVNGKTIKVKVTVK